MNVIKYLKRKIGLFLAGTIFVTSQIGSLSYVQAADIRKQQADELLENALENLEDENCEQGEVIITLEASEVAALVQEGQYRYDKNVRIEEVCEFGEVEEGFGNRYIVRLTSKKYSTEELMKLAVKQYSVDGIAPNSQFQLMDNSNYNDPYLSSQWYLDSDVNMENRTSSGINFFKQKITLQDMPVIAVLDTGVNYEHPDLVDSMWINPYPDKLEGVFGYDFGNDDNDPMDTYGHGTHVAGIAAATQNNEIGITGVSGAKIMALKIAEDNSMYISQWAIIEAYEYVEKALRAGVNIKAINCSWGGNSDINGVISKAITAVGELGALSVFASGNEGKNWDSVPATMRTTPYDLDSPYFIIVGAVNEQNQMSYFSDYSSEMVDVFAPGSNIVSTYIEDAYIPKIYDSLTQKKLTSYYNKFSNTPENIFASGQFYQDIYTASQLGIFTDYTVNVELLSEESEGYLCMEVTRNRSASFNQSGKEEAGSIYVDVTDFNLDPNNIYYVGCMIGTKHNDDISWINQQFISKRENSRFVTIDDRTYMRIVGLQVQLSGIGQKNVMYLDDIAISVANPDVKLFGQYAFLEGTSMAAPVVSGVLATFAGANPEMDASTLRSELLGCVHKVNGLEDKCKTGGIIDYSLLYTRVADIKLNKTTATLKYGKTLTLKAKVTPKTATNAKVTWKSSNKKYATVNSNGVVKAKKAGIGHTIKITVTATDGSKKQAVCKVKIKK